MAKPKFFDPKNFTATEFYSASQKVEFADRLANFLLDGCPAGAFTKLLYNHLNKCFGHIAHYNIQGFYDVWFSSKEKQVSFIHRVLEHKIVGNPAFCFSDVEREFQSWLEDSGLLEKYQNEANTEKHYQSIEDIARTLLKVGGVATSELVETRMETAAKTVLAMLPGGILQSSRIEQITEKLKQEFVP